MAEFHSFNKLFAKKYGIEEAIIFNDLYFWCLHNKQNNQNLFISEKEDEKTRSPKYWTYSSCNALEENYEYMNKSKIYRVIKHLEEEGLIISDEFNKVKFDRTKWYAITEFGEEEYQDCNAKPTSSLYQNRNTDVSKMKNEKLQNEISDVSKMKNEKLQNETAIPDINTDTETTSNTDTQQSDSESVSEKKVEKESKKKSSTTYPKEYYLEIRKAYYENCKILYERGRLPSPTPVIPNAITKKIKDSFDEYGYENVLTAVHNSIGNSWLIDKGYPLSYIFGQTMLPNLINGGGLVKNDKGSAFAQRGTSNYENNVW